jgi:beta-glucosidase-like glycosyl hydrolase
MKTTCWLSLAAVGLSGVLGCNCNGAEEGPPPTPECDKPANVARKAALIAAQPALEARAKDVVTATVTFASEADDPTVMCPVDLQFKDLNDNGSVEGYEDWRKTAAERAADLVGRMTADQKMALMAHATTTDVPTVTSAAVSAELQAAIAAGLRFGLTAAHSAQLVPRATWANNVQELCEASSLGIPFVLSMEPSHSSGNGRVKARGFSQWPNEASLGATASAAVLESFGKVVAQEYRAIGVRMALSPSANLATDPRWFNGQFTLGEDGTKVAALVGAYVKGVQGTALGPTSVAAVVNHFPGAGPAKDGWDARLAKGKLVTYPGNNIDAHLAAFQGAFGAGVAGVMPAYGVLETGAWTGLGGLLDGATIEQVGAAFNATILTNVLRGHYAFSGLVLAPPGILEDAGVSPLGAPWGMEASTKAQRAAKAVDAGVDQFGGLNDATPISAARTAGLIDDAQIDAAARRALELIFRLGLFEDPYVDPAQAPALCNTDPSYRAGLDAMNRGMVLLVNEPKPPGWLNGSGDGTQVGDKGNAGNGTLRVLPAPPGEPYVSAGCSYFIMGDFDLDYVRSVSTGYGELTNDSTEIDGIPVSTPAERIPLTDYVFIRIAAPFTADPDSGPLGYSLASLEYATNANAAELDDVAFARNAIDAYDLAHPAAPSRTQIIVGVDAGRPSVVDEILAYGPSALYVQWSGTYPLGNLLADKVFLDVAFGIVNGRGVLPVGLPLSDAAAGLQLEDLPDDGQHATFVEGYGIETNMF